MTGAGPSDVRDEEAVWTPGAAARLLGVPPSTLRSWHRRYPIPVTGGGEGRHRRYSAADIAALARMRQFVADGMSLASAVRAAFPSAHTAAGPSTTTAVSVDVGDLMEAALRLDAETILATLDTRFAQDGIAATWDRWCRPALTALGGPAFAPADEQVSKCIDVVHLLSWVITAALQRIRPTGIPDGPVVLLACMPGEAHTLPLEVLRAACSEHAVPARFLGADLPVTALLQALRRLSSPVSAAPSVSALVLWSQRSNTVPASVLRVCAGRGITVLLGGPGWGPRVPAGVSCLHDVEHALTILAGR